jgi:Arc/MetJ-type ribon-helix-helix transcriptional regulator
LTLTVEKTPYEKRTKRVTFAMPLTLYRQVMNKLPYCEYTNLSELLRELLRQWLERDILTLKTEELKRLKNMEGGE